MIYSQLSQFADSKSKAFSFDKILLVLAFLEYLKDYVQFHRIVTNYEVSGPLLASLVTSLHERKATGKCSNVACHN